MKNKTCVAAWLGVNYFTSFVFVNFSKYCLMHVSWTNKFFKVFPSKIFVFWFQSFSILHFWFLLYVIFRIFPLVWEVGWRGWGKGECIRSCLYVCLDNSHQRVLQTYRLIRIPSFKTEKSSNVKTLNVKTSNLLVFYKKM
jgi:hypothetical protein